MGQVMWCILYGCCMQYRVLLSDGMLWYMCILIIHYISCMYLYECVVYIYSHAYISRQVDNSFTQAQLHPVPFYLHWCWVARSRMWGFCQYASKAWNLKGGSICCEFVWWMCIQTHTTWKVDGPTSILVWTLYQPKPHRSGPLMVPQFLHPKSIRDILFLKES